MESDLTHRARNRGGTVMWSSLDKAVLPGERILFRPIMGVRMLAVQIIAAVLLLAVYMQFFDWQYGVIGVCALFPLYFCVQFLVYLGSGAILTDQRILHRRSLFDRQESIQLWKLRRVEIVSGKLTVTDTLGEEHRFAPALNLNKFANAIVRRTKVASSPLLTDKLMIWNIVFLTLVFSGIPLGMWIVAEAFTLAVGSGLSLQAVFAGDFVWVGRVLALVILLLVCWLAVFSCVIAATAISPLILRIGLDAVEFRALFDHYARTNALAEGPKFIFHFRAARRFASVLYGERV